MTISQIARNKKVEQVVDERNSSEGNGVWAYLKPGWRCIRADSHACHEETVDELANAVRMAVKCECPECKC